jgi:hypothetical protein
MQRLLEGYFSGERWAAIYTGCVNLVLVVIGVVLVGRSVEFQQGAGWALVGLGVFHTVAAVGYAAGLRRSVSRYEALLAQDAAKFKRDELTRMEGVVAGFTRIRLFYGSLLLAGAVAAIYGFVVSRATSQGVGLSLGVQAVAALALETVDYRRAIRYQRGLRAVDAGREPTDDESSSSSAGP